MRAILDDARGEARALQRDLNHVLRCAREASRQG